MGICRNPERFCGLLLGVLVAASVSFGQSVLALEYANPQLIVDTEHLAEIMNEPNVRIVDVRTKGEYKKGHIPGAVSLSFEKVDDPNGQIKNELLPPEKLARMLGKRGIGPDTRVILYDGTGGFRAARLFWILEYLGHRNVAILNGGYPKWVEEQRKVTKKVPQVKEKTFPIALIPRRIATADWLLDRAGDENVVVIDVRGPASYQRSHIPWAKNIPWKGNINEDKTMKSPEELAAHFDAHGVTKNKNVAVHCQDGRAAAHSYYTLRLMGYPRVRSYDRSWAEWGNADDLPKVAQASNPCAVQNPCAVKNPCAPVNPCAPK